MSDWYQGFYKLQNPNKYIGKKQPFFRSSWEKRLYFWVDTNSKVLRWCSECIKIPYINIYSKQKNYIPDAYIEILNREGKIRKYIIEVKPFEQGPIANRKGQIHIPKPPKNKNRKAMKRYLIELNMYKTNICKWKAAEQFCKINGLEFMVLTKEDLV